MQHQKLQNALRIALFSALLWGLAACGSGQSDSPAPVEPSVAVEATAAVPAKTGNEVAAEPTVVVEPVADQTDPVFEMREPVSLMEAAQVTDLRELPTLALEDWLGEAEIGYISYYSSRDASAVLDFYRSKLTELGWQETSEQRYIDKNTVQVFFQQDDFTLFLSANRGGDGRVLITLVNHGNIDTRALPIYLDAEVITGQASHSMYATPADVASVVEFSRKELAALGWQEYTRPNTTAWEDSDQQALTFKQNGLDLHIYIGTAPAQGGKTTAQYSARLLSHELPTLAQASNIEFDAQQVYLSYTTPAKVETIINFYQQELATMGYEPLAEAKPANPEMGPFFYANDDMTLRLSLSPIEASQVRVVLQALDASELVEPAIPETEEIEAPFAEEEEVVEAEVTDVVVESEVNAPDLPVPADAQNVEFDASAEEISFTSPSDIETLVAFYRESLAAQGWQEDETFSSVEEDFAWLVFEQGEASLDLDLFNDSFSGETEVSILTYGLAWGDSEVTVDNVESETGPVFTLNDWPIPDEAEEVKVAGDEVSYVIDWDFQTVADFYRPTFAEWDLLDSCLETEEDFSSYSCSTMANSLSVTMFFFEQSDGRTEVTFTFYGLTEAETDTTEVEMAEPEVLTLIEEEGIPVPSDLHDDGTFGSEFRMELTGLSAAGVTDLVELYRRDMPARGWTEQTAAAEMGDDWAILTFEEPDSLLIVELSGSAGETKLFLTHKRAAAAREMGILPPAGQARLYLVNMNTEEVTLTIAGQTLQVAPSSPESKPEDFLSIDLAPGEYTYTLITPGQDDAEGTLELGPDETWSMALLPGGTFPIQAY